MIYFTPYFYSSRDAVEYLFICAIFSVAFTLFFLYSTISDLLKYSQRNPSTAPGEIHSKLTLNAKYLWMFPVAFSVIYGFGSAIIIYYTEIQKRKIALTLACLFHAAVAVLFYFFAKLYVDSYENVRNVNLHVTTKQLKILEKLLIPLMIICFIVLPGLYANLWFKR